MRFTLGRRQFIAHTTASLTALVAASPLRAALLSQNELNRLLGTNLPPQLTALLPQEVFDAAAIVRGVMGLEQEAKAIRLPPSRLSLGEGGVPTNPERLYELVLPRLVALVDRAELRNPVFADKAGGLLAKLHGSQHIAAQGLKPVGSAFTPLSFAGEWQQPGPITLPGVTLPDVAASVPPVPVATGAPPGPETDPADNQEMPDHISKSLRFETIADEYEATFKTARFRPEHQESVDWHLTMMRQSRSRYEAAGKRSAVPWYFIAAVHGLEASFNFRAHFHNGDFPLSRRTHQVPAGRPLVWLPPSDWESSTADALHLMGFARAGDWSLPRTLYRLEAYNGFGYRRIGRATPYLWSFSTAYDRGKFVADGRFDPRARSQQCGAAVMLKLLADAGEIAFPA